LSAGDLRFADNEAAIARVAGTVDMIPKLIDVKFDSLIGVLKTRDSIAAAMRSGRDLETKTPTGKPMPELSIGTVRARAPAWLYGALVTLALVLVAAVATVGVVGYFGGLGGQAKAKESK
jgi:anti-sigma factor RsiW